VSDIQSWTDFERRSAAITRNASLDDIERETREIDESAAKVYEARNGVNTITLDKK
jgi:hypothetical protein